MLVLFIFCLVFIIVEGNPYFDEKVEINKVGKDLVHASLDFSFGEKASDSVLFADSLYQTLKDNNVSQLEISISQGFWRSSLFGASRNKRTAPGVEILASFKSKESDLLWHRLLSQLNGLFCTAIYQSASTNYGKPSLLTGEWFSGDNVYYSAFTGDFVCTENVEAFKKLLACQHNGFVNLLGSPKSLYDTKFTSTNLKVQFIDAVWTGNIVFDFVKTYKNGYSLRSIFGGKVSEKCPVARNSEVFIDGQRTEITDEMVDHEFKITKAEVPINGDISFFSYTRHSHSLNGKYVSTIRNKGEAFSTIYFHQIPWQISLWFSTIQVNCDNNLIDATILPKPSIPRQTATLIEINFTVPSHSTCQVSFEFEKTFLLMHEYPPDANHGIPVPGSVLIPLNGQKSRLYSEPTVIMLPLPDSTMPYNVLCFVCTMAAFLFQIVYATTSEYHSVLQTSFKHRLSEKLSKVKERVKSIFGK